MKPLYGWLLKNERNNHKKNTIELSIRYLTHSEIDSGKWDACISKAFNGMVYAYSWYLDTVCEYWEALVEDDYKSVFPLTWKKKMGIYYLFQPFFAQQLGIFSQKLLNEEIVSSYIEAIPNKYHFVEINLNAFNKLNQSIYNCITNKNHHSGKI